MAMGASKRISTSGTPKCTEAMRGQTRIAIALTLGALSATSPTAVAAFAGDNGRIAFVRNGDIWTVSPDGAGQAQLTTRAVPDSEPAWSADGTLLAFTRLDGGNLVYRIGHDGQGVENLAVGQSAAWSPDGTRLVFSRVLESNNPNSASVPHVPLFLMNADGSGARPVEQGLQYSFNPDWAGDRIAHDTRTDDGGSRVRMMSEDGLDLPWSPGPVPVPHPHPANEYDSRDPSWSPDGNRLVFRFEQNLVGDCHASFYAPCPDPNVGLTIVDRDGSGRRVIPDTSDAHDPVWSPDGTRVAFTADRTGRLEVYVTNLDGSGQRRITNGGGIQPDWQAIGPAPEVTGVAGTLTAGAPAATIVVSGSRFVPRSVVRWNGMARPTSFVSPAQLVAQLGPTDVAQAGTAEVRVFTSPVGGGTSPPFAVTVAAPPEPPAPAVTISRASIAAKWKRSRVRGRLVVAGRVDRPATIEVALLRGSRVAMRRVLVLPGGAFARAFPLRPTLLPGRYVVRAREQQATPGIASLTDARRAVRLGAPTEGVVRAAAISTAGRNGPAVLRQQQTSRLFARFAFAAVPKRGKIVTEWYLNGRLISGTRITRPRGRRVDAVIRSPRPLARGRWQCMVRVGRDPVAIAAIRVG